MMKYNRPGWLFVGDTLAILVVTFTGFVSHYGAIRDWRWITTFLPVLAAWLTISPWLGLYRVDIACQPRQVWRPALAALLSAPLAATLRGFWLSTAIMPVFVLVLGLTNTVGLLLWRTAWAMLLQLSIRRAG